MKKPASGGGWRAILYSLKKAREVGGFWKLWTAMRSKNACKTCALGMGGQQGGMVNEAGSFPEVCKKSLQAMAADMQGAVRDDFWSTYSLAQLQKFTPRELEHCGRLTEPVVVEPGSQYYRPITWDDALGRITKKLRELEASQSFWYFSGRSSTEAGFLLQLLARLYGTNNVNNCSFYCHQASGVGLQSSVGTGTATIEFEDVEHADMVMLIGGNPASNHPRLMSTLMGIRNRGGEVIVVNPVRELGLVNFRVPSNTWSMLFGTKIASLYCQPHIGGDLALISGIAKRVVELGGEDREYLKKYTTGHEAWLASLEQMSWAEITEKSGTTREEIDDIARRYIKAKKVVFGWTMGITHHVNGVKNVQAIANLAMLRGMVGRPGAGLMPIRGHSNVQAMGSVGVTPKLKDAIFERLEKEYSVKLPTSPGLDTLGCMEGAMDGSLKFGLCLGGNLYGSNPDATFAGKSLAQLDMLVYLSTTLNTGHAHGIAKETIILPVLARDEEPQATTQESMFNYIRLSDGGPRRHEGPRSEVEVIARIGEGALPKAPLDWQSMTSTGKIRQAIAKVVPGFEQIATIDKTKKEFAVAGRVLHEPKFPTKDGKGVIHTHELPPLLGTGNQLRLMTVRSEGQFNTVVYETEDLYRGQERRDVILMHPDDLAARGLKHDQLVSVTSETGRMENLLARSYSDIRAGNALVYYPEANVLVPRSADPESKTPAFKNVLVVVEPMPAKLPVVSKKRAVAGAT
ncbi:oxidoreductase alpha (molybdopterin) subunit [Pirellula staleyi DSM 6068]|uniref:Oxidoreductase alpha (Molybdopterin) subunit n=1 Tax=Pirellula staleyi (strain ATCC 27377 / DSM 6068 / ICPB 4128) TaxID=530564 RepID=D2QZ85_PIRSD|nr:FdhF/YdeP family oxidoreductase [Pirellula staleyi]ADB18277.1 oxidoreductase alpha (molybdopterin) subunit [Pirellula staleyi DSM 6068]